MTDHGMRVIDKIGMENLETVFKVFVTGFFLGKGMKAEKWADYEKDPDKFLKDTFNDVLCIDFEKTRRAR